MAVRRDTLLESFGSLCCVCPGCNHGLLKQPLATQTSELRLEAQGRSRRLFASHSDLRAILDRHEATIGKRWAKKTKSQRQAILLRAWPSMPTAHRPDFEHVKKEMPRDPQAPISKKHRDLFIWPYISQECLSKPKTLPLLLNARGRHDPCDFAAADGEAMRLGISLGVVEFKHLTGHAMVLNGAVGPDEYGQLVAIAQDTRAYDWLMSGWQFLPGKGLVILEAQERLLSFLVSCCKQILHEIPDQTLTGDAFAIKPTPHFKGEAETDGFISLTKMAAEAPFRVPSHLDFGHIESLLAAKACAAEDHLWSLREDPGYFAGTQLEFREHQLEMIKSTKGNLHPLLSESNRHLFLAKVTTDSLVQAYASLDTFSDLHRQARELSMLQIKYSSEISPSAALPEEYLRAILKFRHFLRGAARGALTLLNFGIPASPPLRKHFVRDARDDLLITYNPQSVKGKIEKELFWLLQILRHEHPDFFSVRMPLAMEKLERLLESEQTAKEMVSPHIAGVIGEISIVSQCLNQLDLYQPWANGFTSAMERYQNDIAAQYSKRYKRWFHTYSGMRPKNLIQVVRLVDVSGGGLAYPIDKRRTKENVAILRKSEAKLDAFWAKIDGLLHTQADDLEGSAVPSLFSQQRAIQRTPEWVEPIKEPKKSNTVPTTDHDVEALYKPLSTLYIDLASSNSDNTTKTNTKVKAKTKTRGIAKAPSSSTTEVSPPEDPSSPAPPPTIAVDARALKVFRTLFFQPSPTATPGEIAWNDFLHALTSTGFAAEKLYGSAWQFRPITLSVDRGIQFHEPHPGGKIPFRDARRHGRRLNRAFGWSGGMFTLREK